MFTPGVTCLISRHAIQWSCASKKDSTRAPSEWTALATCTCLLANAFSGSCAQQRQHPALVSEQTKIRKGIKRATKWYILEGSYNIDKSFDDDPAVSILILSVLIYKFKSSVLVAGGLRYQRPQKSSRGIMHCLQWYQQHMLDGL